VRDPVDVTYRRDDDGRHWLVWVTEDERQHSYGRTIRQAREAILDVIALWHRLDDPTSIELHETYDLAQSGEAVADARSARDDLARAEDRALRSTAHAVRRLLRDKVSLRDAAAILGISYQRVHQLTRSESRQSPAGASGG